MYHKCQNHTGFRLKAELQISGFPSDTQIPGQTSRKAEQESPGRVTGGMERNFQSADSRPTHRFLDRLQKRAGWSGTQIRKEYHK